MLNKVFSVLMTLLFLLITSHQALILAHFKLNQDFIVQEFCINKSLPELECHGKCHLNKELKQTNNTNPNKLISYKNFDLALVSILEFEVKIPKFRRLQAEVAYKDFEYLEIHLEIFVPPPMA